jgi:WD40 repeat protein
MYGQKPKLIIPSGQNSRILAAKITPNGKYFLSAANDRSIKIYDVKEKKEVFTFWEHESNVDDIAIAPNNRTVVSVADGGEVLIWDLNTAKVIHRLEKESSPQNSSIAIHPNGKTFLIANDGYVSEYDIITGKLLMEEEEYHDIPVNKIGYLKNGKEFFTSAKDNSKLDTIWNFTQNKTIDKEIIKAIYYTSAIYQSCTFSEDGFTRYDVTKDPEELRITYKNEKTIKIPIENYLPFDIEVLSKESVLIACRKGGKISFLIFNLITMKVEKVIDTESYYDEDFVEEFGGNFKMQIIPNTNNEIIYYTGIYDSKVFHINLNTGDVNLFISNKSQGYTLYPSKENLFLIGYENSITKWNLSDNIISTVYSNKSGLYITPLKEVNHIIEKDKIFIWDKNFIKINDSITLGKRLFGDLPSPDEKYAYLNLQNRPAFLEYDTKQIKLLDFIPDKHYSVDWLDSNVLVFLSEVNNQPSFLYTTKEEIQKVVPILFEKTVQINTFSQFIINRFDDTFIVAYEHDGTLSQMNQNGEIINIKKYGKGLCHRLEYDSNLQQIIASFDDGVILFINPETLEVTKKLEGHKTKVDFITFSEDYKKVFSFSYDNTIKIWDYDKGTLLSTLSVLNNRDWVVVNEDGLFDASPQAMKDIYYVVNDAVDITEPWKIIELEQLKHRFYQPNLLQIQLGYNKESLRTPLAITDIPLPPKVSTTITDNTLKVTVKNQNGGIGKVVFFIENAEIITDIRPNKKSDEDAKELSIEIDLDMYKNRFTTSKSVHLKVIAWNKEEWIRSRPEIINYIPIQSKGTIGNAIATKTVGEKPRLFGLIVGTSDYAGKQIDLNYAAKDAIDFANALQIVSENLFDKNNTSIELLSSDGKEATQKPTRKNILNALKALEEKIKPTDILVVYLSGHGVNYGGAEGDFYYLTQEASILTMKQFEIHPLFQVQNSRNY